MGMFNPPRPLLRKLVNSDSHIISKSLNKITHNEISRAVKAIMAMDANIPFLIPSFFLCSDFLLFDQPINEYDESINFFS